LTDSGTPVAPIAYVTCLPYLVIFAALKTPALPLERIGDLSYGVYVFGMPVQQGIIASFHGQVSGEVVAAITTPIVLVLAFASWRLVEKPVLGWRTAGAGIPVERTPATSIPAPLATRSARATA
jgi:peptidoglycan/LPS O-acetylase OafA/YrhL